MRCDCTVVVWLSREVFSPEGLKAKKREIFSVLDEMIQRCCSWGDGCLMVLSHRASITAGGVLNAAVP